MLPKCSIFEHFLKFTVYSTLFNCTFYKNTQSMLLFLHSKVVPGFIVDVLQLLDFHSFKPIVTINLKWDGLKQ